MNGLNEIMVAVIFNITDIGTGLIAAVKTKDVMSSKLRDGMFKKVGFLICYFVAWMLDHYGGVVGFNLDFHILPAIILYVVTTELVSILENVAKINPDLLPAKLLELFHISPNA